ncbi:hypothetical protein F5Y19DRAFT_331535 [Xylariaceae sp. FL1651]|nr:hypothetical protein F5Y19DRAFT_331535 [Xylariaceae sp. FL1651]
MPAMTPSNGAASAQAAPKSKRFELPALDFKFGSLTDGTNIPPPLPSPKEEAPTQPKVPLKKEKAEEVPKKEEANGASYGYGTSPNKSDITITTNVGVKRPAEEVPASPAPSSRGSLRRLISRTLLNGAYNEQGSITGQDTSRPPSRTASVTAEGRKAKRSSGWFRRLRSHDNPSDDKRDTHQFEEVKKPAGPPPPMIPELSALETKIDTQLGEDLFKGIGKGS